METLRGHLEILINYNTIKSSKEGIIIGNLNKEIILSVKDNIIIPNIPLKNAIIQGDKLSRKLHFAMNRYYNGIDLIGKEIYINFKNTLGNTGNSKILKEHTTTSDNTLEFDWWVSDKITILSGNVEIQVEICSYDESGDVIYRYQTIPFLLTIEKTLISDGNAESGDYYLDISFYNKIENILSYDMASSLPTLEIKNRCIIMPTLKDIVVTEDTRSRIIHFSIERYIDNIDLSLKVICIKFKLSNNTGDRSIVCNKVISPTTIAFDWLLDSRVTLLPGTVEFAIEFIGYNEHNEFYCWNTLPATLIVSKGLKVDDIIEQPTPSWIQSWNILADKYLKDYLTYIEQIKENIQIAVDGAERAEKWAKAAKESEILAGQEANTAFEYATIAEEAKNIVLNTKADFDIKYQNFLNEIPKLYESDEKLAKRISALEKPIFLQQSGWENITSGETLQIMLGKLSGWYPHIKDTLEELKKSVSDGKTLVAAAITRKRINTAADATFQQMANNIDKIALGWGNAQEWQVLENVVFANVDGIERIGTMPNQSREALARSPIALGFHPHGNTWSETGGINTFLRAPKGYYDGDTWLGIACPNLKASNLLSGVQIGTDSVVMVGTATDDANAGTNDILEGKSGYVKGQKITGGITSHARNPSAVRYIRNNNNRIEIAVDWGFYECYWDDGSYEYLTYEQIAQTIGLSSAVLRAGYNICGVQGDAYVVWTGDATAAASHILYGRTAWVNGQKITGEMPGWKAIAHTLNCGQTYTIPAGQHSGSGTVTANSLASQTSATATASNLLTGKTAWVNGQKINGTIANQSAGTTALSFVADQNTIYVRIPAGAYLTPAGTGVPEVLLSTQQFLNAIGVIPSVIKEGTTILGVQGTYRSAANNKLFDYGTTSDLAGGWNGNGYFFGGYNSGDWKKGTYTLEPTRISLFNRAKHSRISLRTNNTFNLSGYSKLQITYDNPHSYKSDYGARLYIGIISSSGTLIASQEYWDESIQEGIYTNILNFSYSGEGYVDIEFAITDKPSSYYVDKYLYLCQILLS